MRMLRPAFAVAAALLVIEIEVAARAGDLLPPDRPIAEVVDHYIDAGLKKAGVTPAGAADDATVIRRLTLDLAGRIPTAAESRAYRRIDRSRQARPAGRPLDGVSRLRPASGHGAGHDADGRLRRRQGEPARLSRCRRGRKPAVGPHLPRAVAPGSDRQDAEGSRSLSSSRAQRS